MSGLQRICKMYGGMIMKDKDGKEVEWAWDYVNEKPRIKKEMTKKEIDASEKEKYRSINGTIEQ